MFVQTEKTPNPNSLKFLPGKAVSNSGPVEIINKDQSNNELVRNLLLVDGFPNIFIISFLLDLFTSNKDCFFLKKGFHDVEQLF